MYLLHTYLPFTRRPLCIPLPPLLACFSILNLSTILARQLSGAARNGAAVVTTTSPPYYALLLYLLARRVSWRHSDRLMSFA